MAMRNRQESFRDAYVGHCVRGRFQWIPGKVLAIFTSVVQPWVAMKAHRHSLLSSTL